MFEEAFRSGVRLFLLGESSVCPIYHGEQYSPLRKKQRKKLQCSVPGGVQMRRVTLFMCQISQLPRVLEIRFKCVCPNGIGKTAEKNTIFSLSRVSLGGEFRSALLEIERIANRKRKLLLS